MTILDSLVFVEVINRQITEFLDDLSHTLGDQHLYQLRSYSVLYVLLIHLPLKHVLLSNSARILSEYDLLSLHEIRISQVSCVMMVLPTLLCVTSTRRCTCNDLSCFFHFVLIILAKL